MQSMTNTLTLLTLSACLGACVPGAPEILPPASSVTRREALETSRAYTSMAWRGSPRNVRHGTDEDGIRIDTPDAAAACFSGVPMSPAAGDAAVSRFAAGVDCSGFVSRCWRLSRPFSTRELPALSISLPSWDELKTGDILIAPGRHVLLFIRWEGAEKDRFLGSEAGPLPVWKCAERVFSRPMLENSGYRPMRYRGMRDSFQRPASPETAGRWKECGACGRPAPEEAARDYPGRAASGTGRYNGWTFRSNTFPWKEEPSTFSGRTKVERTPFVRGSKFSSGLRKLLSTMVPAGLPSMRRVVFSGSPTISTFTFLPTGSLAPKENSRESSRRKPMVPSFMTANSSPSGPESRTCSFPSGAAESSSSMVRR